MNVMSMLQMIKRSKIHYYISYSCRTYTLSRVDLLYHPDPDRDRGAVAGGAACGIPCPSSMLMLSADVSADEVLVAAAA